MERRHRRHARHRRTILEWLNESAYKVVTSLAAADFNRDGFVGLFDNDDVERSFIGGD